MLKRNCSRQFKVEGYLARMLDVATPALATPAAATPVIAAGTMATGEPDHKNRAYISHSSDQLSGQ